MNNLFSKLFLDEKIEEAVRILFEASKTDSVLSFSGGADSVVMSELIKMYHIPIHTIFFNKEVEGSYNRKIIKKVSKTFYESIDVKSESYASIVSRIGFPIGNKNFSRACFDVGRELSSKNIIQGFKRVTGISPNDKIRVIENQRFSLELRYWHLAKKYPIQERCCSILKKQPSKKVKKDMIIGIMKSDSLDRRRAIAQNFHGKYFPLQSWNKQDVFEFIKRFNVESSKAYQDRPLKGSSDIVVVGATNTGCSECHFGQNQNHFLKVKGKNIKTSKFDIMKLEKPKAHKKMMNRKHVESGITYGETIKAYEDSKAGLYIRESIVVRNAYITRLLELGKDRYSREAKELLKTLYIEQDEIDNYVRKNFSSLN